MIMTSFIGGDDIKEKASSLFWLQKGKKNFHMVGFSWGRTQTIGKYYLGELNAITIHIPLTVTSFLYGWNRWNVFPFSFSEKYFPHSKMKPQLKLETNEILLFLSFCRKKPLLHQLEPSIKNSFERVEFFFSKTFFARKNRCRLFYPSICRISGEKQKLGLKKCEHITLK